MIRNAAIAIWFTCLAVLPAAAAPLILTPNTPLVGESGGLLMTTAIGLNAYKGRRTPLHLKGDEAHTQALAAQALLLYLPGYTPITPNLTAPFLTQLGAPTNVVPKGKTAAPLFVAFGERFLKVGNSASQTLGLPIDGKRVKKPTRPIGLFIAHDRADKDFAKGLRFDTVLGRAYAHGWVLFRTNMYALNGQFWDAQLVSVPLPRPMRRVLPDGTLGPPRTHLELGGYEGAVLIHAD